MALAAIGLLAVAVLIGLLMQLSPRWALAGRRLLWYSSLSLLMAVFFTWAVTWPLMCVLSSVLGDTGGVLGLWASGPLGLIMGFYWAWRHPEGQRFFERPGSRWMIGGTVLVLLAAGAWLFTESTEDPRPKKVVTPAQPRGGHGTSDKP
jgi:hypothetical protein